MIKKLELAEIGSLTAISFPEHGIKNVPAKVDTGADSSSIWASNITEKDGKLKFMLFDTFSPFYSGQKIETKNYTLRSIKNSFGKSELRYRVSLPVMLEGRQINVNFTLANRSNNRFPILIGRRTLQNKFIVNVAKTPKMRTAKVLVLVNKPMRSVSRFFDNIEQNTDRQMKFTVVTYDDLVVKISKNRVQVLVDDIEMSKFNLIYLKTVGPNNTALASVVSQYAHDHGISFFDAAHTNLPATTKLQQYVMLSKNGIPVPKSLYISNHKAMKQFAEIKDFVGMPFIYKDIKGEKGYNNFLIKSKQDFIKANRAMSENDVEMIAQQFIPNDGDYRLLVLGDNVELIIHRQAQASSHLNNTSNGATANLIAASKLPAKIQAQAIKAAALLMWNVAGVDVVQDKVTGSWYCLEVNNSPQIASGAFVANKETVLTDFLQKAARVQFKEN